MRLLFDSRAERAFSLERQHAPGRAGVDVTILAESEEHVAKKSVGETVLGWFVVREDEEGDEASPDSVSDAKAKEELVERYAKRPAPPLPPKDAPKSVRLEGGDLPLVAAGKTLDAPALAKVYEAAKITPEEQERVQKAKSLVDSLPIETPNDVKRQIVEASLKAFGVPIEAIVETGVEQIQALEAYIQHGARHTQSVLQDTQTRIERLQQEITEIKKLMELQVSTQQSLARSCNDEKVKVQRVLEFFGQEIVAKVVRESPKLVEK